MGLRTIEMGCLSEELNKLQEENNNSVHSIKKTSDHKNNIEAKYLRINLDSKFLQNTHVHNASVRFLMMCRQLCGKNWGCIPKDTTIDIRHDLKKHISTFTK